VFDVHGTAWAKRRGATLKILRDADANKLDTAGPVDVRVIRPAELPFWAAAGRLRPVPADYTALNAAFDWAHLLPLYRDKLLVWNRTVYGFPVLGDAPLCFYRTDLFGEPRHKKAFAEKYGRELKAPATWADFADIAEYFYRERMAGGPAASLPPLPESTEGLDYLFYAIATPYARRAILEDKESPPERALFSFHYDLQTGRPRIEQPGFVHALEVLQRLQKCRPAGASTAPPQAFADGQAVLCLADASWAQRFRKNLAPPSIGVCRVPHADYFFTFETGQKKAAVGGNDVPYLGAGGWVAVVPQEAPHSEAAFALLAELAGKQIGRQIVFNPRWGGGYRQEHFAHLEPWYGFDLDESQTVALKEALWRTLAHPGIMNPVVRLRIPDQAARQQALVEQLRAALAKGTSAGEALRAAARRWEELDKTRDAAARKDDYRLSLSLAPAR
jgi:ABC-type glycerol-3-phosphate transport system substrate-binding protein